MSLEDRRADAVSLRGSIGRGSPSRVGGRWPRAAHAIPLLAITAGLLAGTQRIAATSPAEALGRTQAVSDDAGIYLPALLNQGELEAAPAIDDSRSHYVSADALATGDGSFDNPWPLQVALDHPAALKPGDTVWLRAGTYTGTALIDPSQGSISFVCKTQGSERAPIVFRNYSNERVVIDGEANAIVLFIQSCSHTWFWGLEVMSSAPIRGPSRSFIYVTAPDVKFINMLLHDMADGIDLWTAATNAELYGSIIYHNGWDEPNGGHGHGIYTQNTTGTKRLRDNIFFSQYGYNVDIWSTNQSINNYDIQHNIVFNGGALSEAASRKFNFFMVGNNPNSTPRNLLVKHNYTYAGRTTTTPACNAFGPNYGVTNLQLEDNMLLGQLRVTGPYVDSTIAGNTIMGGTALPFISGTGFDPADFPDNRYAQDVPTQGLETFVLPNAYETGRAHIAIYNWSAAETVTVDLSSPGFGLGPGDRYELIQVMDFHHDIITGTLAADGTIEVPMTGHTFAQAIGSTKAPVSQFPEFGAFVIRKIGGAVPTPAHHGSPDARLAP